MCYAFNKCGLNYLVGLVIIQYQSECSSYSMDIVWGYSSNYEELVCVVRLLSCPAYECLFVTLIRVSTI